MSESENSKNKLANACFYFFVLYISLAIVIFSQDPFFKSQFKALIKIPDS